MVAMTLRNNIMEQLLSKLAADFPSLTYAPGKQFCWSPETGEIFYNTTATGSRAEWSLLHETGHALLAHKTYSGDFELLKLEICAWDKASDIAKSYGVIIDDEHIQDCLDSYRDWLYSRSICPTCSTKCLQQSNYTQYRCFNCHTVWGVSPSRFCRSYRSTKNVKQPAVFHLFNPR